MKTGVAKPISTLDGDAETLTWLLDQGIEVRAGVEGTTALHLYHGWQLYVYSMTGSCTSGAWQLCMF